MATSRPTARPLVKAIRSAVANSPNDSPPGKRKSTAGGFASTDLYRSRGQYPLPWNYAKAGGGEVRQRRCVSVHKLNA
jgi:hypothetical protein